MTYTASRDYIRLRRLHIKTFGLNKNDLIRVVRIRSFLVGRGGFEPKSATRNPFIFKAFSDYNPPTTQENRADFITFLNCFLLYVKKLSVFRRRITFLFTWFFIKLLIPDLITETIKYLGCMPAFKRLWRLQIDLLLKG